MALKDFQDMEGYSYGDFVQFKHNKLVYNEIGLPMFRDIYHSGWLRSSTIMRGTVCIHPVDLEEDHRNTIRVPFENIVKRSRYIKGKEYQKTTDKGFTVLPPVYNDDPDIPRYAGSNIPIHEYTDKQRERLIEFNKEGNSKKKKISTLDEEIKKQKEMVNGKVKG